MSQSTDTQTLVMPCGKTYTSVLKMTFMFQVCPRVQIHKRWLCHLCAWRDTQLSLPRYIHQLCDIQQTDLPVFCWHHQYLQVC